MQRSRRLLVAALAGAAARPLLAQDGTFPSRPVKLIPFGTAGGPIDLIARLYAERLRAIWNQPVLVEPKPGASGIIAADSVARSQPDGYTLMLTLSLTHTVVPVLQKVPYDPLRDFTPLALVASGGPVLIVPASLPVDSLQSFVAWAKEKGRVTYGTWGRGSGAHITGETLKAKSGAPMEHVAYKSEATAHADLFGGLIDAAFANPATAREYRSPARPARQQARILGIAAPRRVGILPDVPTFAEQGFAGMDLASWMGFFAPAKLPADVASRLGAALRQATASPEVQARLSDLGFEPLNLGADAFAGVLRQDVQRWTEQIRSTGITLD